LIHIDIINIALNYKCILYTKVIYINCLASNLNIYINKTPVLSFDILFNYLFINKKLYYNNGLFLNKSINLASISL